MIYKVRRVINELDFRLAWEAKALLWTSSLSNKQIKLTDNVGDIQYDGNEMIMVAQDSKYYTNKEIAYENELKDYKDEIGYFFVVLDQREGEYND